MTLFSSTAGRSGKADVEPGAQIVLHHHPEPLLSPGDAVTQHLYIESNIAKASRLSSARNRSDLRGKVQLRRSATFFRIRTRTDNLQGSMFVRMTANGRLLGLDVGDWSMLLCGLILAGLLTALLG